MSQEAHRPIAFPRPGHNHASCLSQALDRAESAFAARGLRLTDLRRAVLTEIAGSHKAVGAYEVQERLADRGMRLAPISIYRAIDALVAAGLVHRLESRNAYFACLGMHAEAEGSVVLTCEACARVAEVPGDVVRRSIEAAAVAVNFRVRSAVVEVVGLCADCR
jgi:Fur family zinc uptake transcriptional regulator